MTNEMKLDFQSTLIFDPDLDLIIFPSESDYTARRLEYEAAGNEAAALETSSDWDDQIFLYLLRTAYAETPRGIFLIKGMRVCGLNGWPAPNWLASAFIDIDDKIGAFEPASWDELLGKLWPKRIQRADRRRAYEIRFKVYKDVHQEHKHNGRSLDEQLFGDVGARYKIGARTAAALYYDVIRLFDRIESAVDIMSQNRKSET